MQNKLPEDSDLYNRWKEIYEDAELERILTKYEEEKEKAREMAAFYRDRIESEKVHANERAVDCLREILHKKLFNAQCLWRAERLDIPLKNTWAIQAYASNIFRCDFLEPITREEIDEYIRYWLSERYKDFPETVAQDHERLKAYYLGHKYNALNETLDAALYAGDHYPHWYAWYDECFGTNGLLTLEDVRGYKESVYLMAYRKAKNIDNSKGREAWKNLHLRKQLMPLPDQLLQFAEATGDVRMLAYFKDLLLSSQEVEDHRAESALMYLQSIFHRQVPVEANADWRIGIDQAAHADQQKQALKCLPEVYEAYLKEGYFYDKFFDQKKWDNDQRIMNNLENNLETGRRYIEENPEEFKGY